MMCRCWSLTDEDQLQGIQYSMHFHMDPTRGAPLGPPPYGAHSPLKLVRIKCPGLSMCASFKYAVRVSLSVSKCRNGSPFINLQNLKVQVQGRTRAVRGVTLLLEANRPVKWVLIRPALCRRMGVKEARDGSGWFDVDCSAGRITLVLGRHVTEDRECTIRSTYISDVVSIVPSWELCSVA